MASFLRPRRGKLATATAQLTASAPLKRGEIFFEVPDTGVGTGAGKIKMGDGTTAYASLPYFLEPTTVDYTNAVVGWTNTTAADSDPYSRNATYASNIIPSASLKTIFTNLKKLLLNYNSQLTTLNNDLESFVKGDYDMTLLDMVKAIYDKIVTGNDSSGPFIYCFSTGTYDLSDSTQEYYVENYQDLTMGNFYGAPKASWRYYEHHTDWADCNHSGSGNVEISYNASTGILKITSTRVTFSGNLVTLVC